MSRSARLEPSSSHASGDLSSLAGSSTPAYSASDRAPVGDLVRAAERAETMRAEIFNAYLGVSKKRANKRSKGPRIPAAGDKSKEREGPYADPVEAGFDPHVFAAGRRMIELYHQEMQEQAVLNATPDHPHPSHQAAAAPRA